MLDPAVLIHGAWAGSWGWERFAPLLRQRVSEVIAVDLPGNGAAPPPPGEITLDLCAEHVLGVIRRIGRPVSLIAHSGGGMVASQVAEMAPDVVAGIVYVAGFMLPDGVSFAEIVDAVLPDHPEAIGINESLKYAADGASSTVPADAAARIFFSDCAPEVAAAAASRLTPQPQSSRAIAPHVTAARFGAVPRLYVEATEDLSVVLAVQRRMQALVPGAAVVSLPAGHAPQVSMPAPLLASILPFLQRIAART
jgi:pimeloyl-ACP methyl ester carboxylesterase